MPFAPVVLAERAAEPFDSSADKHRATRRELHDGDLRREGLAASASRRCVHVDGTARPQLIDREQNPVYHDVVDGL
jgi:carbamoyltransferase